MSVQLHGTVPSLMGMFPSFNQRVCERMDETGLDGYTAEALIRREFIEQWNTWEAHVVRTFTGMGEAISEVGRAISDTIRPDPDAWSLDAYSETGGSKGGIERHPYIQTMRDIDRVLAEPDEPVVFYHDVFNGAQIVSSRIGNPVAEGWGDESADVMGDLARAGWRELGYVNPVDAVSFDAAGDDVSFSTVDETHDVNYEELPAIRSGDTLVIYSTAGIHTYRRGFLTWSLGFDGSHGITDPEIIELARISGGRVEDTRPVTQVPRQPSESPQERALRLRRGRGTGPPIPRAQGAHRPRRHT